MLIETPKAGLSRGMQLLNGRYAQAFNAGRRLDGHLFQGRFGSVLVESDGHATWLNRYIARNPVEAGLGEQPSRVEVEQLRRTTSRPRAHMAGARRGVEDVRKRRSGRGGVRAARSRRIQT
jgi:hypothetical protein